MSDHINIILQGITGSTAYGLATEHSDIDRHGIFLAPNATLLGILTLRETVVTHDPDSAYHELGKYVRLAAKANPTVLELMFLDSYEVLHPAAQILIDNRDMFLSKTIFKSYGGYALSQAKRLDRRGDSFSADTRKRTAKHARHLLRLIDQGTQLLTTGTLDVKVKNREELFAFGELPVDQIVTRFFEEFETFDAIKTDLPDTPDFERINRIVLEIREAYG